MITNKSNKWHNVDKIILYLYSSKDLNNLYQCFNFLISFNFRLYMLYIVYHGEWKKKDWNKRMHYKEVKNLLKVLKLIKYSGFYFLLIIFFL